MAARKNCQTLCLGARPRYNLVVDEDVKKPTKQTNKVSLKESDNHRGMASPHVTGERQEIGQRGDNEKTRTGKRETAAVESEEAELNTEVQSSENIQIEEDGQIKATKGRKRTRNEEN